MALVYADSLRMNGLDYVILGLIALGAVRGSAGGVLRIASSLIGLAAAVYLASIHNHETAEYLAGVFNLRPEAAAVLGFVIIFLTVMVLVSWGGAKLTELIQAVHLSWVDRLGGALVGAALGALVAGFLVVILTAAAPADTSIVRRSRFAPHVLEFNHTLAQFVPQDIRDAYMRREAQLIQYWNEHRAADPRQTASSPFE
jgi:membrane protein required for colicin V production